MYKIREFRYKDNVLYLKCTKCGKWDTLEGFPKDKDKRFGVRSSCKVCYMNNRRSNKNYFNEYSRRYYLDHKSEIKHRIKKTAKFHTDNLGFNRETFHRKARKYATKNHLKPEVCPICGRDETIEMHHPSYNDFAEWSRVVFCCKFCHKNIHLGLLECPKAIDLLECDSPLKETVR